MKYLLQLTFYTLALTILLAGGQAEGKEKHKHPNPFHVLGETEVQEQIRQRNWHYSPATPIKLGKFHFTKRDNVLVLRARYSMHCRGGKKRCRNCKAEIDIHPKHEFVVRDFKCKV